MKKRNPPPQAEFILCPSLRLYAENRNRQTPCISGVCAAQWINFRGESVFSVND